MADLLTLIRVIDTETSDLADPKELVEIGWTELRLYPGGWSIEGGPYSRLVNPGILIQAGAMAAHHLSNDDVADGLEPNVAREILQNGADILCFHHAEFDLQVVKSTKPFICTMKVAKTVYPDLASYKNGALWYGLGLGGGAKQMEPVHRAGPDSWTTAHILLHFLEKMPVEEMIQISANPLKLLKIGFGKHAGSTFKDLPWDYLDWLVNKSDMRDDPSKKDVIYTARQELLRRGADLSERHNFQQVEQAAGADPDAWRGEMSS